MQEENTTKFELYASKREKVPAHIQEKYFGAIKKILGDVGNYSVEVAYAITGNLIDDPRTSRVLSIDDITDYNKTNSESFVGPIGGTTSSFSTQVSNIFHMVGVEEPGKVEKIIYHRYDTDVENSETKIRDGEIFHDEMTQIVVPRYDDISNMFAVGEKGKLEYLDIVGKGKELLIEYNIKNGLAMYKEYVDFLHNLFAVIHKRNPTDAELYAFAFANSEHCNHPVFNAELIIDGEKQANSLFDNIKETHKNNPGKTLVAYVDDAAAFEGKEGIFTFTNPDGSVTFICDKINNTLKVESHNFPSMIFAFEGFATGIGGLLRDLSAIGRGGTPNATMSVYIVSSLIDSLERTPRGKENALNIIAYGSIGASSYCNEFGVPAITGKFTVLDVVVDGVHYGYDKPTVIVGGKGNVFPENVKSKAVPVGAKIVYVGGDNKNIGFAGGVSASQTSDQTQSANENKLIDEEQLLLESLQKLQRAVQRGDAIMESKVKDLINSLTTKRKENIILTLGDVGASGWTNTVQEILKNIGRGGNIDYSKIPIGDESMEPKRVLSNESQERYIMIILPEDIDEFEREAKKFNTPYSVIGEVTEGSQYTVYDPQEDQKIIDMDINDMLGHNVKLVLTDNTVVVDGGELDFDKMDLNASIEAVISHPNVGNKDFLVTIGDRSVGGKVTQDQMVGPWQTPLSNVGVTLHGLEGKIGEVMTQANREAIAIIDPAASCRMATATAVLKSLSAYIPEIDSFSGSGNWMFDKNHPGQLAALNKGTISVRDFTDILGFDISVGKDSGSMREGDVVSPLTFVVTLYADTMDVNKTLTPDLKNVKDSELFLIDFGEGKNRMGASLLAQVNKQFGNEVPDVDDPQMIRNFMEAMIELHEQGLLLAYHKKSDGGLFAAISEMSFASHIGIDIDIQSLVKDDSHENKLRALFNQEQGVIMQFESSKKEQILEILRKYKLEHLGHTIGKPNFDKQNIGVSYNGEKFINERRVDLQKAWSKTSNLVKTHRKNNNPETTQQEFDRIDDEFEPGMEEKLTFDVEKHKAWDIIADYKENGKQKPKVAVLSTEGTNSQEEMKRYFNRAGFEVYDIHLNQLISGEHTLDEFDVSAIAGGFSHGDALGAGVGFAQTILERPNLREQFQNYQGKILGVCNGFQVITELAEILPGGENFPKLKSNKSNSFEARRVLVEVTENSDATFFKGMHGSVLSQIQANGEGNIVGGNMKCNLNFVDNRHNKTEMYPYNPTGSKNGDTGFEIGNVCGMMGHPEREWKENSPWLQIALNLRQNIEEKKAA